MRKTIIPVRRIIDLSPRLLRGNGVADAQLRNLRPAEGVSADGISDFVPVGAPVVHTGCACWTPVVEIPSPVPGSPTLLLKNGTMLAAVADISADSSDNSTDAGSGVLCAMHAHSGETFVMTESGPKILAEPSNGSAPQLTDAVADYPAVVLRAVSGAPVQATVGARKLSRAYTSGQTVSDADNRALVGDYVEAYRSMVADAAAAGCYVQPVLARYRLLDSAGRALFESAPALLSHPEGSNFAGSQPLYSSDGMNVEGYTLTARSWALMVETAPCNDPTATRVAAVEVLATPQFHPYNPKAAATVSTGRLGNGSTPWAHVALPGRSEGLSAGFGDSARRRVMKAIARMEEMEQRMAYVTSPFRSSGLAAQPLCAPESDPANDSTTLRAGMRQAVRPTAFERVLLSAPHSFSASHCAAGGATVAWAGVTVHRYRGYRAAAFAATTDAVDGHALISVKFKGMLGVMRQEVFSALAPTSFGPILCYPSPDAVEMTISTTIDGVTRRRVFALEPDESGRRAVYVEPSLSPIALPVVSVGGIINVREPVENFPGAVAIAGADMPLAIKAYSMVSGGDIRALLSRHPGESSWEFGRERFLAACADRVVSVGVDTSSWRLSLRALLTTGVERSDAAVAVKSDIFILSGTRLMRITPRGSVSTVDSCPEARSLAYDATHGELLAITGSTEARAYTVEPPYGYYSRTLPAITEVVHAGGRPFGATESGLAQLDCEDFSGPVEVAVARASADSGRTPRRPVALRFVASASDVDGRVTVGSCNADGGLRRPVCALRLSGPLVAPLSVAVAGAPVRVAGISFSGKVTDDFRLSSVQLITD